jgi:hypothetical protein
MSKAEEILILENMRERTKKATQSKEAARKYLKELGVLTTKGNYAVNIKEQKMKTQNVLIAHPTNANELGVIKAFFEALNIKFEVAEKSPYNPEFVTKIQKSRKQAIEGKTTKIALDDIWK